VHPAASIILFTVASGIGYGMLAFQGLHAMARAPEPVYGVTAIGIALALVTAGLLSSTFHLGRPERAWRALSQWRSSWLSREGVLALLSYPPALALAAATVWPEALGDLRAPAGLVTAVLAAATVECTAMIYASLTPIRQWHSGLVPALYLAYAAAGGVLWMAALARLFGFRPPVETAAVVVTTALCWALARRYWRHVDRGPAAARAGDALGLGPATKVRPLDPAHTEENYIQREMGFRIARRHAKRLRRLAERSGLALPILLALAAALLPHWAATAALVIAAGAFTFGALVQRWLFFAEATHTVTLYYGADLA
jgi:DMSO reductase anchor subunit